MHNKNRKSNAKSDNTTDINTIGNDPLPPKSVRVNSTTTNHPPQPDLNSQNIYSNSNNIAHIMNIRRQQRIWLVGGIVSLLPVLVIGIFQFVHDASFISFFSILSNTSLMYTGVTLVVSAINDLDFTSDDPIIQDHTHKYLCVYIVLSLSCIACYIGAESSSIHDPKNIPLNIFLICLNLSFIGIPIYFGHKQYKNMIERSESHDNK